MSKLHLKLCKQIHEWSEAKASDGQGLLKDRFYDDLAQHIEQKIKEGKTVREAIADCFEGELKERSKEVVKQRKIELEKLTCTPAHPQAAIHQSGVCMHWNENLNYEKFNPKALVGMSQFCNRHLHGNAYDNDCKYCKNSALFRQEFCYDCRHLAGDKEEWLDLYVPSIYDRKRQKKQNK